MWIPWEYIDDNYRIAEDKKRYEEEHEVIRSNYEGESRRRIKITGGLPFVAFMVDDLVL